MSFQAQFTRLHQFLVSLECLGAAGQAEAFTNEALETGGRCEFEPQFTCRKTGKIFENYVVDLYGLHVSGVTEFATKAQWKRLARKHLASIEDDGMVTVHPPLSGSEVTA